MQATIDTKLQEDKSDSTAQDSQDLPAPGFVDEAKKRMLKWPNPVEYVNNMYGCHPGDDNDYFSHVFGGQQNEQDNNIDKKA